MIFLPGVMYSRKIFYPGSSGKICSLHRLFRNGGLLTWLVSTVYFATRSPLLFCFVLDVAFKMIIAHLTFRSVCSTRFWIPVNYSTPVKINWQTNYDRESRFLSPPPPVGVEAKRGKLICTYYENLWRGGETILREISYTAYATDTVVIARQRWSAARLRYWQPIDEGVLKKWEIKK